MGIKLTPRLDLIYNQNFIPLLQNIKKDLEKWSLKHFSWFGRAAIIKMTILPRILYYFQTIPILLPSNFFPSLNALLRNFLWASKKPCINLLLLTRDKHKVGMGFPNFKNYFLSTHLTRIVDWMCHADNKDWKLENSIDPVFTTDHMGLLP